MSIALYSGSQGPLGTSIYTFVDVSAPAMYVPRLYIQTKRNNSGTNIDTTISTNYPLTVVVDGVTTVRNTLKMKTTFTALQNVVAADERARIFDEHVAFLTAHREKILVGDATA